MWVWIRFFSEKGKAWVNLFFFFFLNNTCFMDYFLFQKWVFLCWGCWPCLSGCATVGCSSLSDAESIKSWCNTRWGSSYESQRIVEWKTFLLTKGGFQGNQTVVISPETFPRDLLPWPKLTAADGNKPTIHWFDEVPTNSSVTHGKYQLHLFLMTVLCQPLQPVLM